MKADILDTPGFGDAKIRDIDIMENIFVKLFTLSLEDRKIRLIHLHDIDISRFDRTAGDVRLTFDECVYT